MDLEIIACSEKCLIVLPYLLDIVKMSLKGRITVTGSFPFF